MAEAPRCRVCKEELHWGWGRWTHAWSNAVVCVHRRDYTCWGNPETGALALATHPDDTEVRYGKRDARSRTVRR